MQKYIRTCQECSHRQTDTPPPDPNKMTEAFRNRKCKRCKSEALDLGSEQDVDENLRPIHSGEDDY